jgi:hypothetical protein
MLAHCQQPEPDPSTFRCLKNGQSAAALPEISDIELFCDLKGVDLDTLVPHRAQYSGARADRLHTLHLLKH